MFSAKGTTQTKTTAAPKTLDKGRSDAASKSVAALTSRKKVAKRDNSKLVYAGAAVFAILVIIMLSAVLKKKPGSAASSARSAAAAVTRKAKKAADDPAVAATRRKKTPQPGATAAAPAERRTPRSAGLRSREPVASRRERVRTARVPREKPVRTRDKASRRSSGTDEVTAIGEGTALIGKRTVRVGDVVRGRVVREIGSDVVKIEYGGTIFSIRIGEALP